MALVQLNGAVPLAGFWPIQGNDVYVRERWDDPWTWIPWLTCTSCEEVAPPGVGTATLRYDFGRIKRAEFNEWAIYYPWFLNGCYVAVVAYDYWGEALLWTGVIDAMTVQPHGFPDWPQGVQTFTAYELHHLLDRRVVAGAHTVDGYITMPMIFNEGAGLRGLYEQGNMGEGRLFTGQGGERWSNYDILHYLMTHFVGIFPDTQYEIVGEWWTLQQIFQVHHLDNLSVLDAINQLIDRRRGLGWRFITAAGVSQVERVFVPGVGHREVNNGAGTIFLWIYSTIAEPMAVGGYFVPPNAFQSELSFVGSPAVEPEIHINNLALFDHIQVLGGPISATCSLSYADGTLIEGWDEELEQRYRDGSTAVGATADEHDANRAGEMFADVFCRHRVPEGWDFFAGDGEGGEVFNSAVPSCDHWGTISAAVPGVILRDVRARAFERTLPFRSDVLADVTSDYQMPVAFLKVPLDANAAEEDWVWVAAHRIDGVRAEIGGLSFTVADRGLAVVVRPRVNHLLALRHWSSSDMAAPGEGEDPIIDPAESNTDPEVDYRTLVVTVMFKTDEALRVEATRNGAPITSVGRTKRINVPDAEAHYVVPGTVVDVEDGALVRHAGGFERDDSARLLARAAMAMAWYGTPRATLRYEVQAIHLGNPVGTMVRGVWGPEGYTIIGTVVTRRSWSFSAQGMRTTLETGFEEWDYQGSLNLRAGRQRGGGAMLLEGGVGG